MFDKIAILSNDRVKTNDRAEMNNRANRARQIRYLYFTSRSSERCFTRWLSQLAIDYYSHTPDDCERHRTMHFANLTFLLFENR